MNTALNKIAVEKFYHLNPYQRSVQASILDQSVDKDGCRLLLDKTVFYPGGGGQLPDEGTIDGYKVLQLEISNDQIWHLVDKKVSLQSGSQVNLELDWDRRYYQMQQHTAQHLLSAVLASLKMQTVSVHLGKEYTLIEVGGHHPNEAELQQVENEANELIRRMLSVKSSLVSREEIDKIPLRREAGDYEILRVIEIDGLDFSACGGTHLKNTAEIGLVKWIGIEKIRGHSRIKFLSGEKAYQYFRQLHNVQNNLKEMLQTDFLQFAQKIELIQQQLSSLKREKKIYRKQYLDLFVKTLAVQDGPVVLELQEENIQDGADIALKLAGEYSVPAFLYGSLRFFISLPRRLELDAAEFLAEYKNRPGLKGGGSADFVQGKISMEHLAQVKKSFLNFLNSK